ncbi:MAG: N-acetylmuramoyl-L-alanine amidase [Ruminococcaceae bacterium]|nr:N-acetylmuramoyl-L-alanine amidase [Oscillospiraceae bacterium]
MTGKERTRQPERRPTISNNQLLLIIIGVLAMILVVLVVVIGIMGKTPAPETAGSQGTTVPTQSEPVTEPTESTEPTTQPTQPTQPTTEAPTLPVTPSGGKYTNVGYGYIAEVIRTNVETFDGKTSDDYSHPTNNYLPEGTLDYCAREPVYGSSTSYALLRSGHRVYVKKKIYPPTQIVPEIEQYEGMLPDHNEIGFASMTTRGRHTVLTLDCLWKAPFYFDIAPQKYANPNGGKDRNYAVTSVTATYVDITFCYATSFTGTVQIPNGNPLFKSAEVIENESDYTLRLHLRKKGGFYGWHAYYNEQDQLCFQFLNPAKVTAAANKYGANLTGVTVMIDVGHGGLDGGAVGKDATGKQWDESELNMLLAQALKAELESVGATVIFNRTEDVSININDRLDNLVETSPDVCIAIHQNSYKDESITGFDAMYFTPYSKVLAERIAVNTKNTGIYKKSLFKWSVSYFMMRQTVCPIMLTENGYLSNVEELTGMFTPEVVQKKASAIAQGISDYFLEINK